MQDHVVHFYHLHALDWVDIVSALSADPGEDVGAGAVDLGLAAVEPEVLRRRPRRVKAFVDRGQLGPFANAYWGHPAYRLPPEANLMAVAHYLEALDWQREFIKMHAVLGGKNPHLQSFLVGGMATPIDPDSQAALNAGTIAAAEAAHREGARLRRRASTSPTCSPIASFYKDWAGHGRGVGNYLVYGEYPDDDTRDAGAVPAAAASSAAATCRRSSRSIQAKVTEYVAHSWYQYQQGDDACAASISRARRRRTTPGPKPPYERLDTDKKYSWLKSPRYDDEPMEVGPLARMLVRTCPATRG